MLKFTFVPKSSNNPFQKLEVNLTSLSETIAFGNPCNLKNLLHEDLCNVISPVRRLPWYKMCYCCQLVYHNHDGIMLSPSHWKSYNRIHGNNFSFPLWNWQRLQQTSWVLMLNLHLLTFHALRNILRNVLFHSWQKNIVFWL